MSNIRLAFLLPLFAGLVACSSSDSGGGDDTTTTPDPIDGGSDQAPIALDFTSSPEGTPKEDERWEYELSTSELLAPYVTFNLLEGPTGMSIVVDDEDGTSIVVWTPTDDHGDQVEVTIQAVYKDGTSVLTREQVFVLTVEHVNDKPEIISAEPTSAIKGTLFSYQIEVSDPDDANNGSNLIYTIDLPLVAANRLERYNASISATGLVEIFIPTDYFYSKLVVEVTVTDGQEDWKEGFYALTPVPKQTWSLNIFGENLAPEITSSPILSAVEDTLYSYQVTVSDIVGKDNDGNDILDDISFSLNEAPEGMTLSNDGVIEWTPLENGAAVYDVSVEISVADGGENDVVAAVQVFDISVTPVNDAPVINGAPLTLAIVNQTYVYQIDATDVDDTDLTYTLVDGPVDLTLSATGLVEWTPVAGTVSGSVEVSVADDGENGAAAATSSWTINVRADNVAPVIEDELLELTTNEDTLVSTTLIATDADADMLVWSVSFLATNGVASVDTQGVVEYTPSTDFNGTDSFEVTVTDGSLSDVITVNVSIDAVNDAPVISSEAVTVATEAQTYTYAATATDVENDVLVWSLSTSPEGMTIDSASGEINWTPSGDNVSETVTLAVDDGTDTAEQTFVITVAAINDAPVITEGDSIELSANEETATTLALNATDVDSPVANLTWSIETQASNGIATISGSGETQVATYTSAANFTGNDSFVVIVTDGDLSDSITVNVTVADVNDAPVISEGATVTLAATEDTATSLTLNATDIDTDLANLSWSVETAAENGVAEISGVGASQIVAYTPALNFYGTDTFVVEVSDGVLSDTILVTVTVGAVNDAPVVTSAAIVTATEDTAYIYPVLVNDVDGDELVLSLSDMPEGMTIDETSGVIRWTPVDGVTSANVTIDVTDGLAAGSQTFTINVTPVNDAPEITSVAVTSATEGETYTYAPTATDIDSEVLSWSLTQKPQAMNIDAVTGVITWTPANAVTSAAITLVVSDGELNGTQMFTITVGGVNDAPVITEGETASIANSEDTAQTLSLNVTDADNSGEQLTWSIGTDASNGTAEISGTGNSQTVTYTPNTDFNGADTFTVEVTDGLATDSIVVTATIAAVNDAPVVNSNAVTAATEGNLYTYSVIATDVDQDTLEYTLSAAPQGMNIDAASGVITWTPENNVTQADVTLVVSDGELTATQSFTIAVSATNDAPVFSSVPVTTATEDEAYSYTAVATDADNNILSYDLTVFPAGMTINAASGVISWTPADGVILENVTVTATDSIEIVEQSFTVSVTPVNDAPEITEGESADLTTAEDTEGSITLNATDIDSTTLTWSIETAGNNGEAVVSGTGASQTITYTPSADFNGVDTFIVEVSDGADSDLITVDVIVDAANDAPIITSEAVTTATEDEAYSYTVTATDIDEDTLTFSLTSVIEGMSIDADSGVITWTPANNVASESVTVEVTDTQLTDTQTFTINVTAVNDAPEITSTPVTVATEEVEYVYAVLAEDIDGDTLEFSLTASPEGMVINSTSGVISWTPANGVESEAVTVEVTDGQATDTQSFTITVSGVNDAPVISEETAEITTNEDTEGSITLNATDIDGDTVNWTVSSLASNGVAVVNGSGTSQLVSYTPNADFNGVDTFTVEITDGNATDNIDVTVTVNAVNDSPVFANAGSTSAVEGSLYQYTPVVTDVDDENNGTDLTFTLIAGPDGMNVSATGVVTWTPPNGVSEANVTLQVADGGEDASVADSQSWTITVGDVNDAPNITSNAPTTATEDVQYQYQVQVTDPDDANNGTDLTFTLTSAPEGMTVSTMGLIQWTPENNVFSADVTVQVADGGESGALPATQSWSITVTAVNDAPEITSTAITTATEDEAYSYTVTATDVDIDTVLMFSLTTAPEGMVINSATGQITWTPGNNVTSENVVVEVSDGEATDVQAFTINVTAVNDAPTITSEAIVVATEDEAYSYVVTAEDIDGDNLTFSLTTKPAGMTIDATSGEISWTPANNVTSEMVTVQVSDGTLTASQTFTITVAAVNDAPEITSTPLTGALEDTLYSYDVNATDIDGDTLSYSLSLSPEGMVIDESTGVITWTPANGVESEPVTVEVTDGQATDSQSFTITVGATNDAPEITEGETATLTTTEDVAGSITLNATDIDGDDLTWNVSSAAGNGTAVISGTGTSISVEYTPAADFNGADSFTVQVSDATATDTVVVNVTVDAVNDAPVVTSTAITTATEDTAYAYTVTATDVDGDTLVYSLSVAPEGMTIDAASGVITWTPANGVISEDVIVDVSDSNATDSQSYVITVSATNDAPTIDSTAVTVATEDEAYSYTVTATDIDGDTLAYSLTAFPAGMSIDAATGVISWTPANGVISENVTVEVTDTQATDSQSFNITVTPVNDAPEITSTALTGALEDTEYSYTVVASDVDGDELIFSLLTSPEGMGIDAATGVITWTPANGVESEAVTVEVSDGQLTDTQSFTITVGATNDAPVITEDAPTLTTAEDSQGSVTLNASDIDGDTLNWSVSVSASNGTAAVSGTGDSQTVTYTPNPDFNGADSFTVQVSDATATDTVVVNVTVDAVNDAPVVTSTAVITATEDTTYAYTVMATDVDGDTLSYSLSVAPEGMNIDSVTGAITWTPENDVTNEAVTVEVSDASESATQSFTIAVTATNDAPVIDSTAVTVATEDEAYIYTVTATDVDGDTLAYSLTALPAGMTIDAATGVISWTPANGVISENVTVEVTDTQATDSQSFIITVSPVNDAPEITSAALTGALEDTLYSYDVSATDIDGDTLNYSLTVSPAGMVIDESTGEITWTPANGVESEAVTVEVSDGQLTDTQSFTITVGATNDAPVITEDAPTLTTAEDTQGSVTLNANDIDGDTLNWSVSVSATNGTAAVSGTGDSQAVTYTPNADFNGADSFTVQVSDATATDTVVVNVTVDAVNDAPVVTSTAVITATEDTAYAYTVMATDVDGDTLSYSLSVAPEGMNIDSASGAITWTPENGVTNESVTVEVSDASESATQSFTIAVTGTNDAPTIDSTAVTVATEDEAYSYTVTATDVDGDTLAYSLTAFPAGMTIDAATGEITWTPANNVTSENVTVEVTDSQATDSQSFTINVTAVNDAPEITSAALTGALEDTLYSYDVNATDIDGDTLSYSLTVSPAGMVIDESTGEITWTPANGVESEAVTVEVSDGQLTDTQSFTITVGATNDAPEITEGETATLTTTEDVAGSITLNAIDIDGDDLTWNVSSAAGNGTVVISGTGTSISVEYTPAADFNGSDIFTVQVSDGTVTDTVVVNVTVDAVNDAPVVTSTAVITATEDTAYAYTVMATDVDGDTLSYSLSVAPEGMNIDSVTGAITWTPENGVTNEAVTVEVSDASESATQSFTIAVTATNDAPVIDSTAVTVATEDEAYIYTVTATDIDGDTLAYSLTAFPAGMSINAATGEITWTPANNVTSENVTVEVTDSQATDSQSFTIAVTAVNDAPEITEVSATIDTDEDNTGSVTLNATDVDGDTITWSIATNGANGSAVVSGTGASQTINYTPNANFNGSDSFTVQVSDNQATDTLLVNVTVNAANDAPLITSESVTTATEDEAYAYTVTASDVDDDTLEFSLTLAPEGMNIDSASGAITWTPANGVTSEPVTVQVSDSQETATQSFTITVTPVNDAPVITSTAITGATEAVEYTYTVVANDIDGDTLEFALTASPAGMVINSTSGLISWTPANGVEEGVVTVEVTDGQATATQSFTITVGAVNDAPVITEGATTTLATDEDTAANLTLNATDADGDGINWSISGVATNGSASVSGIGASQTVSYTPAANFNGTDSFTVQVSDGILSDTIVVSVTVNAVADAPVITEGETSAQSTNEDTTSAFALNATDVDGGTLTWIIASAASNGEATVSGTGASQTVNYVPDANFNGIDTFVVQVSDGALTDTITVTMTVAAVNDLPVITSTAVTTATEGQVYTYLPAATDVENDTLTWNVGTAPASMSVNSTTGELTWTPANGDASAPVTLIVNDVTGSVTQSFTIAVTAVNDAPVITEGESTAVTMDEDATPQAFSLVLNATDADNTAAELTWSIASAAANGSATVSGTGTSKVVNYAPNADYSGADSFTVDVTDGNATDTITVNVTVEAANDAPIITEASAAIVTDEDVAGSVTLNATDIDTDAANITWTILTPATNGTASVNAINTGASMLVTYSPAANTNGADSFVVQISDGELTDTITVDVTVNVVDDAPAIAQGSTISLSTDENTMGSVTLSGIDIDTDAANLSWTVITDATNGAASISGSGASISADYTPSANFSGNDSFVVELSDGTSTATITVNVTVNAVNVAPVITNGATATMTTDEDNQVTLSLAATDADNDDLTWSISSGASQGGVAVDANGFVTYVPALDTNGTDNFTVQVSDGELTDTIDVTVTINAVNDLPAITEGSTSTLTVNEDETGSLTFNATDADNDPLTWSLNAGALNGIVTINGSQFSYTPGIDYNGSDSFTVQVSDGIATATNTVTVTVAAVNDAPAITSNAVTEATENQVYAYDVTASDVEGDTYSFALTTSPSGMQIDMDTGEIRWIPSASGTEAVVVSVNDGNDTETQTFDIIVAAEPNVAGRAVKGVLADAIVEAAVYEGLVEGEHTWEVLETTVTDANGYFGFDLSPQSAPVRLRVITDIESTMVCDTPSGCLLSPPAIFGDSGTPVEGLTMDTIVSGADFTGSISITPMTHMAASWLQAFPQELDDNNVLLAHRRLAKLFGFDGETYVHQRAIDLTDSFELEQAIVDDMDRVRHAIFAASLQETAIQSGLSIDSIVADIGLIFNVLGGQMPLKSGVIDITSLNLVDVDGLPITEISYTGFDTLLVSAKTVANHVNVEGVLDSMVAGFDSLLTTWNPDVTDASLCLNTDPELDRTECRNVTTIAESTGYDVANFNRAKTPLDVYDGYSLDVVAAEAGINKTNRDLGWLYVTTEDQTNTANLVTAFGEVLGYGVTTAMCVPQANTFPYLSCDDPVPSETFTGISPKITKASVFSNRCSLSDDESCELKVTGTAQGQTFNVTAVIPDIRFLLGGTGGFTSANGLNMCYSGTISNSTAELAFNNFCLKLDVSGSRSELLDTFAGFSVLDYANVDKLTPALEALVAEINLEASIHNGLTMKSTQNSSLVFTMSNIDMGFVFDREVINGTKDGPIFNIYASTLSRTNPAGETLNSISGQDLFRLEINDTSIMTTAKVENTIGLPSITSASNITIEGLGPLIDVLEEYALSLIDTTQVVTERTPEEWQALQDSVMANLVYGGTQSYTMGDTGDTYIVSLNQEGFIDVNQTDGGSTTNLMRIFLSGATGYIYADETLVATVHLGNSQDGLLLSFVNGTQRNYVNASADPLGELSGFFDFITILIPPTEEVTP